MDLKTQECNGKSYQKGDANGALSTSIVFLTAFTTAFLRFETAFQLLRLTSKKRQHFGVALVKKTGCSGGAMPAVQR